MIVSAISLSTIALVCAIIAWTLKTIAEERGWLRSTRSLRMENTDLVRINDELRDTVRRHTEKIEAQNEQIITMRAQIQELEKRDQASVILAIDLAKKEAVERHNALIDNQIESTKVLRDIHETLRSGQAHQANQEMTT